ncbi:RHS repeat-associated core domain-containing protein [Pseudomonas sichuanensis]|uniref:RHS repeat-associated core domain-containing protein n=1 Tax=Pseudomonas sichuanensis TaxID=2213015 RepID=UPI00244C0924|nr:RHS repeat-associated core domain-containing protein [Pseudomonas sichuanensis]MDH0730478.1 RHS repeat-associated core domain-containing protein [Pseudomonas sichuanensis]MDH0730479.1 RHS repeat-associated core domain-containing protein [Pseudomonas sichuanensis]MDH1583306.1 RHS repeat-associated core domain-containing protein [Pseudomonas sichuanensis]MDH1583307.1 RHS repeat-associated core domain-containing protein [Pseudomonas sichuanensis]MDH1591615.1 RHS repeat-associated core domain-c
MPTREARQLLFYKNGQVSTLTGLQNASIFRANNCLMAEFQHQNNDTILLAADRNSSNLMEYRTNLRNTLNYTPYGALHFSASTTLIAHFNGEKKTEQGSYLLKYRWYIPSLMRFSSADRLSPFFEETLNAYAYCSNNPANYIDPSGSTRKPGPWLKFFPRRQFASRRPVAESGTSIKKELSTSPTIKPMTASSASELIAAPSTSKPITAAAPPTSPTKPPQVIKTGLLTPLAAHEEKPETLSIQIIEISIIAIEIEHSPVSIELESTAKRIRKP